MNNKLTIIRRYEPNPDAQIKALAALLTANNAKADPAAQAKDVVDTASTSVEGTGGNSQQAIPTPKKIGEGYKEVC